MSNLLSQDFSPRTKAKDHKEELYCVMADKDGVCVSTKQGSLTYYDLDLATELWNIKLSNEWIHHSTLCTKWPKFTQKMVQNHHRIRKFGL